VSYERRHYSVGWNSVVSSPRARAKAPSPFALQPLDLWHSRPSPSPIHDAPSLLRHLPTLRILSLSLSLPLSSSPSLPHFFLAPARSLSLSLSLPPSFALRLVLSLARCPFERLSPFSSSSAGKLQFSSSNEERLFSLISLVAPLRPHSPFVGRLALSYLHSRVFHLSLSPLLFPSYRSISFPRFPFLLSLSLSLFLPRLLSLSSLRGETHPHHFRLQSISSDSRLN